MPIYNVLSWQNENSLSGFPFAEDQEIQDFIVDARFVQFDNFVPTLNYILIETTQITLSITFDHGTHDAIVFFKSDYLAGESSRSVKISMAGRCLGSITFGPGAATLWTDYIGRKLNWKASFLPEVVRSIPSKDAVYTLDSFYGNVTLGRTSADKAIFYNSALNLNAIVFNAVGGHSVEREKQGLRQINLVKPKDNNINLASNDIIKISPVNTGSLQISLVSGSSGKSFTLPTMAT